MDKKQEVILTSLMNLEQVQLQLYWLATFPPGWDGKGAKPINPNVCNETLDLLYQMQGQMKAPLLDFLRLISPGHSGSLILDFEGRDPRGPLMYLEISVGKVIRWRVTFHDLIEERHDTDCREGEIGREGTKLKLDTMLEYWGEWITERC